MAQYYVIRDKNTGLYFRGKGVNRWGKHYNQASIYRIKANAENTIKEVSWRGEQAEIVPIQIVETTEDVVPKSEAENYRKIAEHQQSVSMRRYFEIKQLKEELAKAKQDVAREIFGEIESEIKLALESNYKAKREHIDKNYYCLHAEFLSAIQGKIDALRGIDDFIAELQKEIL